MYLSCNQHLTWGTLHLRSTETSARHEWAGSVCQPAISSVPTTCSIATADPAPSAYTAHCCVPTIPAFPSATSLPVQSTWAVFSSTPPVTITIPSDLVLFIPISSSTTSSNSTISASECVLSLNFLTLSYVLACISRYFLRIGFFIFSSATALIHE